MISRIRRAARVCLAVASGLALVPTSVPDAAAEPPPPPEWELEVAPYGWLAMATGRVETPLGKERFTIDAHDVLSSFDLAAMGAVKFRWERWVTHFDVAWAKLSVDDEIRQSLVSFDLTQKLGWFEALGGYRVYERAGGLFGTPTAVDRRIFAFDAMGGLTYSWVDVRLKVSRDPGMVIPAQSRTVKAEQDWVAPYLGFRFTNDFTDHLRHETLLGVGAFGVGDAPNVSWQVSSQFAYAVSEHVALTLGYRALGFRDPDVKSTFHGPMVGAAFRFSGGH
jgi:opacity protein-like surface antigen